MQATYQPATISNVYVGSTVYIMVAGDFRKSKIRAYIPEVGILVGVDKDSAPIWAMPGRNQAYTLPELFVKVD
jgi:hypothetical protein